MPMVRPSTTSPHTPSGSSHNAAQIAARAYFGTMGEQTTSK